MYSDTRIPACAGNIPETIFTGPLPSVGTNSPVSLQSGLLSNVLLPAPFVHEEYIPIKRSLSGVAGSTIL